MALMITETGGGKRQGVPCPAERGARLPARAVFVRPATRLAGALWQVGDVKLIDGVPNGVASLTAGGSGQVVRIQNGSIAVYAFSMLIGLVLLVSVFLLFR